MTDKALASIPLFVQLTAAERVLIRKYLHLRTLAPEESLYRRGEVRREFFLIQQGRIRLLHKFNGQEETLALVEPGGFLGEQALVNPTDSHQHSAQAEIRSEVWVLKGSDFLKLKRRHPHLGAKILSPILAIVSDRLSHADTKLVTLYTTGKIAGLASSTQELLSLVLRVVLPTVQARQGLLALTRPGKTTAVIREAMGYRTELRGRVVELDTDPIFSRVVKNDDAVVVSRSQAKRDRHWHTKYSGAGFMAVPVATGREVLGILLVADKRAGQDFTVNNRLLLSIVARQIATAVSEAALEHERRAAEELKRVYIKPL